MNKIKAVIFDLDGVLIEAKEWHYEALNKALSIFGMEISRYDHLITYDGLPTRRKLEMLTLERGLPAGLHQFISHKKQQYTMEMVYTKCNPVFIHQYALSQLRQDGYKLAVCSNSVRDSVETMLKRADLLRYVDFFLSNQDVKASKPDPEMYLTAFKKLNYAADECLILEDNDHGIRAAQSAGGHLLKIRTTADVTHENIYGAINRIEEGCYA